MQRAETKAQRILQIETLLLAHPEGLSQSEIARRIDVNRSTVHRYLPDLTQHAPIFEEDGRLFIDREAYLVHLRLNLYEALSLHLAGRLLTNQMERRNPHTAALLRKLSGTIEKLSPQISRHLALSADVADDPARFQDPHYLAVLETLSLAWAEGRWVQIWHRHTDTGQVYDYTFAVYFIEPYAVGHAIHAIGLRRPPNAIRTFNLARIERAELTRETYQIPPDFDPSDLLRQAWGIWYTENAPEEVRLRFSPRAAERVLETRWHPSQQTHQEADGSLIWTAQVAALQEMLPWIRGWGADVEVLAPVGLRMKLIKEIGNMQRLYIQPARATFMKMWAKFERGDESNWHPLLWHLLDSAAVAQLIWEDCLSESYKSTLAATFGLSPSQMGCLVSFWVALHDMGKAGPEFQKKNQQRRDALQKLGFNFPPDRYKASGFHATGTTLILRRLWEEKIIHDNQSFWFSLALTLGGHHGQFPDDGDLNSLEEMLHVGDDRWQQVQAELYDQLAKCIAPPEPVIFPEENETVNPVCMLIAGLTTTADWIASNQDFFPFLNVDMPPEDYFKLAEMQARTALTALGWYGWKAVDEPVGFGNLFPGFTPNTIQQKIIDLAPKVTSPFLAIIEAPTGSGKTEAALYLADAVLQRDHKSGMYIAMPTQATSNQMFGRVANFLSRRYSDDRLNLHLVHGAARLKRKGAAFIPANVWTDQDQEVSNVSSQAWFLPRKRTLLAPFGVGTVDQAFLSVLQSKHFFLRLFGLSHKLLIFDEVHAYDVYMTTIFQTLLGWLRAVGTSVIILSATLPAQTRQLLLAAYGGGQAVAESPAFPRISISDGSKSMVVNAGQFESREVQIEWLGQDEADIAKICWERLADGGTAAVICNRVDRAQAVYDAVCRVFDADDAVEIILFHSRFPHCWRKGIEAAVLEKFGKNTQNRPQKAVVIATQVIEQSLDLDFDLLITDLAPVDLLIQRIGRLHRHSQRQNPPNRPDGLLKPVCMISVPEAAENSVLPDFGADVFVYADYILKRTWLVLQGRSAVRLPEETDSLIEAVYTDALPETVSDGVWETLQVSLEKMDHAQAASRQNARNFLIPSKGANFLGSLRSFFSDDVQAVSKQVLKAPTREFSPSVQLVCLCRKGELLYPLASDEAIDLEKPLSWNQVRACQNAAVSLNKSKVLTYFFDLQEAIPPAFKSNAALRWHFPVIFEDDQFKTETFTLRLDKNRGIRVLYRS